MAELPRPIWEGSFTLFGVKVRCYVLEDGQRVIASDSLEQLLDAMAHIEQVVDGSDMKEFTQWIKGV